MFKGEFFFKSKVDFFRLALLQMHHFKQMETISKENMVAMPETQSRHCILSERASCRFAGGGKPVV